MTLQIAALYHFCHISRPESVKAWLLPFCTANDIKGTLLLAKEGINGTVCGPQDGIAELIQLIQTRVINDSLSWKSAYHLNNPFRRMKVKLKKEIVTIGQCHVDPTKVVGEYVEPEMWNNILTDKDITVIDTRNDYEIAIGTFKDAVSPNTENFREFPDYVKSLHSKKKTKIAMFCTGGIRCEKASSLMLLEGFETVYHLKGGILAYLEKVPQADSLWEGECFVFDERVSVDHQLKKGKYKQCYGCRRPINEKDMSSPFYVKGVSCPYCYHSTTTKQKMRFKERQNQIDLSSQ
tara:strand:+ start:3430 stop:4308 length:879 start_codon:yes stop_codon:yes gene_type:complete